MTSHATSPASIAAGSGSNPLTCKQQFKDWQTGPAKAAAQSVKTDGNALDSAANSEDIPATDASLKALGNDAVKLEAYPMPECADPAKYWTQLLAGLKAVSDNANSAPGMAGLLAAEAPMEHVKSLETKLDAELKRTTGAKVSL